MTRRDLIRSAAMLGVSSVASQVAFAAPEGGVEALVEYLASGYGPAER